jgi:L-ribulokinase
VSGEWLLAKAAQIAAEAPGTWANTGRFIESGDWLVWQLTGIEARSLGFAAYKAQYSRSGYPVDALEGLGERLSEPLRIGSPAGPLSQAWRERTGIRGQAIVAVAVIDSHVVLPAIGAVTKGCLVAALGTSAVYLYLSDGFRPLPPGIEGVAFDGSIRDMWCYEAGQASFGDTLAWFVDAFPRGGDMAESFRLYNADAANLKPGESGLVALDWWNGNRVPLADSALSGLLVGLRAQTTSTQIYRAILESLSFGARTILDLFEDGGLPVERVVLTSGLADRNPLLLRIMADVFGRPVEVPVIANPTAVGAAIHGAVAAGLVDSYAQGTERFGARTFNTVHPIEANVAISRKLYAAYRTLSADTHIRTVMHDLARVTAA